MKLRIIFGGLALVVLIGCRRDALYVARVFISHVLRYEYDKAALYADAPTDSALRRAAADLDTSRSEVREARRYARRFAILAERAQKDTVRIVWCCHADSTADSLTLFFHRGRWRVHWPVYQPFVPEEQDTIYEVQLEF